MKPNLTLILALGLGLAGAAQARDLAPMGPQSVLKCDFGKARSGPVSGAMIAPLQRGAFSPVPLESVQLVDKSLKRKIMTQSVAATLTETDTVQVVARLVNCTGKAMSVQARVNFLDDAMAPTEPVSGWTRLFLEPSATGIYVEKSMARRPLHYLIEVRQAD